MLPKYKFIDIDYEIKLVQLYMMALALQICPMRQKYQGISVDGWVGYQR